MLDTMTMTKAVSGVLGAFLIFMLGNWVAESLYHVGGHGHGDDHKQAYVIDTGEDTTTDTADEGPDFAALLAAADASKGERVFGKCKACHKLEDGANGTGPHLFNIVDRATGSIDGFGYSGALVAVTDTWSADALNGFLESPRNYAPGTKMSFSGLKKAEDRANLIAYLATIGG